jgi:hypothetical protein
MGLPTGCHAAFVADMEDVLEVYQRPHDPEFPLVCLDESSKQLVAGPWLRHIFADGGDAGDKLKGAPPVSQELPPG